MKEHSVQDLENIIYHKESSLYRNTRIDKEGQFIYHLNRYWSGIILREVEWIDGTYKDLIDFKKSTRINNTCYTPPIGIMSYSTFSSYFFGARAVLLDNLGLYSTTCDVYTLG